MGDFRIDGSCLRAIDREELGRLFRLARQLRLATPQSLDLPWSSEKIRRELPMYGQSLFSLLNSCCLNTDSLPHLELVPPAPPDQLPVHRCWLPWHESGNLTWEAAHDEHGAPLFIDSRISLLRHRKWIGELPLPTHPARSISVLVAISMPREAPSANVELQRQKIGQVADVLEAEGCGRIAWFEGGGLTKLRERLGGGDMNAVHLIAHGAPGKILWQDSGYDPVWYTATEFAAYFRGINLDSMILTVCDSATCTFESPSLISALVDTGIKAAVGQRGLLDEEAAAAFGEGFYSALRGVHSTSLDRLVTEGRRSIHRALQTGSLIAPSHWALPVLLVRDSPVSFLGKQTRASETVEQPTTGPGFSFVPAAFPSRSTHGSLMQDRRAWLILDLEEPTSQRFDLSERVTIGRSSRASIVLKDWRVSPFHATIDKSGPGVHELRDYHSSTGTFLNGKRTRRAELSHGDKIMIANHSFTFLLE